MVTRFRAAVLTRIDSPLELMEIELLSPLSIGQVLVRVQRASVCGSQILEIAGSKGNAKYLPHLLGHEGFGEVVEIGPEVKKVSVGDKVVLHWRRSGGREAQAPKYRGPNGMEVGAGSVATFSEMSVVSENRITKVSDAIDPGLASLLGCCLSTGMASVSREACIRPGSSVFIFGAGGIGLSVCLSAITRAAARVVVVDKDSSKEQLSMSCGATQFVSTSTMARDSDTFEGFREQFDAVFETTGSESLVPLSLMLTRDGGTVVQLGQARPSQIVNLGAQGFAFGSLEGKRVIFSQGGGFKPDEDLVNFVGDLTSDGRGSWKNLIGPSGTLEEVNDLIDGLRSGVPGRPMVNF